MAITTTTLNSHITALQALHDNLGLDLSNALRLGRVDIRDLDETNKIVSKYIKMLSAYDASAGTVTGNAAINYLTESNINSIIDHSYRLLNEYA